MSDHLLPTQGQPILRGTLASGRLLLEVESLGDGCVPLAHTCCGGCCFLGDDE